MSDMKGSKIRKFIFHPQVPIWVSAILVAISIAYSAHVQDGSRKVEVLKIQQNLRERYLAYKIILDSLQIKNYPQIVKSYSKEDRYQLSRYWGEIQFNEFLTIKKFGRGIIADEWSPVYGVWAVNALEDYPVLKEEFCYFLKTERGTMGAYSKEFEDTIRSEYLRSNPGKTIDCEILLQKRKSNTFN